MVVRKENSTWMVDVSFGTNTVTGKRNRIIKRNIPTRREALEIEQKARIQLKDTTFQIKKVSIDMLYPLFEEENKKKQNKPSYIYSQQCNYNKHCYPYFKNADLKKLEVSDMEKFQLSLQEKGLTSNTVNKIMLLMKKILDIAVKEKYIHENPCIYINKLKVNKKKMEYWTSDEYKHFCSLFTPEESAYELLFSALYLTGMRIGEALALTWEDINLDVGLINVNKTLVSLPNTITTNSPKTNAGERAITINSKLVKKLLEWKKEQSVILSPYCKSTEKLQVFQFSPEILTKYRVRNKFYSVINRADTLKKIRVHDLRHSHVALLIDKSNDEELFLINKRLGHSSIHTTLDMYGHLYPTKQRGLSDKLDEI